METNYCMIKKKKHYEINRTPNLMIFIKFKTAGIISSVNLSLYTKSLFFIKRLHKGCGLVILSCSLF